METPKAPKREPVQLHPANVELFLVMINELRGDLQAQERKLDTMQSLLQTFGVQGSTIHHENSEEPRRNTYTSDDEDREIAEVLGLPQDGGDPPIAPINAGQEEAQLMAEIMRQHEGGA